MTPDPDEVAASLGGAVAEAEPSAEPEAAPGGPPARDPDMMARALGGTIAPTAPPPAAAPPQLPAPDPAQSRQLMTNDGLYDIPAITHFLNAAGFGAQAPGLVSSAEKINDAVTNHQKAQQQLQISKITALGFMAQGWVKAMDAGVPADRALDMVASPAVASGTISMKDYMTQRQQLLALSRDQQRAVANAMMDQAAQYHKPTEVPKEGTLIDPFGRVIARGQSAEDKYTLGPDQVRYEHGVPVAWGPDKPAPKRTSEDDKTEYLQIKQKMALNQEITPEQAAFVKSYEGEKLIGPEAAAAAAASRQAAGITEANRLLGEKQKFDVMQKAREDIKETADKPFAIAQGAAAELRDVVNSAKAGNNVSAALQSLVGTMAAVRSQNLTRINTPELKTTESAGNLWDRVMGFLGKKYSGQPLDEKIQNDMLQFATILEQAGNKKYASAHDAANKLYGTTIPRTYDAPPLPGASQTAPSTASQTAPSTARVAQVQEALKARRPGKRYILTDGTVWDKNADGSVKQVQ